MAKTIIKEIILFILLLLSVTLLLGVLFYDYIPNTKIIPSKVVPYTLPNDIQEELNSLNNEGQNIIKTYSIESSDLSLYESTKEYDKGKANPFAQYVESTDEDNTTTNTNTANTSTNTNTNATNSSTGTFFNSVGK